MAEIRDVTSDGQVIEAIKPRPSSQKGVLDVPAPDPLETAVERMMGVDSESERVRSGEKVKALLNWAKSVTDDHSPENIQWVIRDLEFKVGSPAFGQKMIDYLYTYVGLVDQKKSIDTKLKRYNPYGE